MLSVAGLRSSTLQPEDALCVRGNTERRAIGALSRGTRQALLACRDQVQELPWSALRSGKSVPEEERESRQAAKEWQSMLPPRRVKGAAASISEVPANGDERGEMEKEKEYEPASGEAEGMEE